jgi:hypothetical protein
MVRKVGTGNLKELSPSGTDVAKTIRKIVVIHFESTAGYCHSNSGVKRESEGLACNGFDMDEGCEIETRVVDLEDESFIFWIFNESPCRSFGFEMSFLQDAMAAIVMMKPSDSETIRSSSELLRNICMEFSIPAFLIVERNTDSGACDLNLFLELGKLLQKLPHTVKQWTSTIDSQQIWRGGR